MSVEDTLNSWMAEAIELRYEAAGDPLGAVTLPDVDEGQHAILEALSRVRARLDRVQELQTNAQRARARARRHVAQKEFEAQEAYDRSMQNRSARRGNLAFTSKEERNADASLDSFEQKREAHQASRTLDIANETLEVITSCYWGLSALREEILTLLKSLQFTATATEYSSAGERNPW